MSSEKNGTYAVGSAAEAITSLHIPVDRDMQDEGKNAICETSLFRTSTHHYCYVSHRRDRLHSYRWLSHGFDIFRPRRRGSVIETEGKSGLLAADCMGQPT